MYRESDKLSKNEILKNLCFNRHLQVCDRFCCACILAFIRVNCMFTDLLCIRFI